MPTPHNARILTAPTLAKIAPTHYPQRGCWSRAKWSWEPRQTLQNAPGWSVLWVCRPYFSSLRPGARRPLTQIRPGPLWPVRR